jgi:hypothetical protein
MNRYDRRAAAAKAKHNKFFDSYIKHLPRIPEDEPLKPGNVYHLVFHHDDWCRFYQTENPADYNCDVTTSRYLEPLRT